MAASTGRTDEAPYLRSLGASSIIARAELARDDVRPLESERFGGAIDAVGGSTLATALAQMAHGAAVASVGLAGGDRFCASVMPFLLRGVSIVGIDSTLAPLEDRRAAWAALASDLDPALLAEVTREVGLEDVPALGPEILAGHVRGRIVVDVNR